ncbi:MAG: sodium-dependent transporter [Lachnospiraceae bacterium]|nr:sodium-dependent transporter [Candidatus Equihabitans merdae]
METKRSNFSGNFGFVMAAAGSAVGLGNIWRFPYLAAKHGGGAFLLVYIIMALTFGFSLLTTEIAIGRKTKQGPLTAYGVMNKKFGFLGYFAWIVPVMILPYYCAIGGWVLKYLIAFVTGGRSAAAADGYFTGHITSLASPIIWLVVFVAMTAFVVYNGVEKGIEKYSKILMPILIVLIIGIGIFSLFLSHTDESGVTRTGLQGLAIYVKPDFSGMTAGGFLSLLMDAIGQLFYSISVAMGIMIAYGSYVKKDTSMMKSINQIEFFDTLVAFLAGLMIVPAVFCFMGTEGMSAGPGLMFISLPKIFDAMGIVGTIVGILFFVMVTFAAVTSSVSVMEAIVSGIMDKWHLPRKKTTIMVTIYALVIGIVVCLGYNLLYFEYTLPNGSVAQILDIMDYISNSILMPVVALITCILVGYFCKPKTIIDEVTSDGSKFGRKTLYIVMIKYVMPVIFVVLLLQAMGILKLG